MKYEIQASKIFDYFLEIISKIKISENSIEIQKFARSLFSISLLVR